MNVPTEPIAAIPLDEQGRIAVDLPCAQCGYNLRGLTPDGTCPECGKSVAYLMRGYYLEHSDAGWVRSLARGLLWLIITAIVALGIGLIIGAVAMVLAMRGAMGPGGPSPAFMIDYMKFLMIPMSLLGIVTTAMEMYAFVLLTRRDPADADTDERINARRLLRYMVFILPVSMVYSVIYAFGALENASEPVQVTAQVVSAIFGLVLLLILSLLLMRLLMNLMPRARRPGLNSFARIMFWGLLISGIVSLAGQTVQSVYGAQMMAAITSAPTTQATTQAAASLPSIAGPPVAATGLLGLGSCVEIGFRIAAFVLIIMAYRALANAAKLAEQNALVATARPAVPLVDTP